MTKKEKKQLAIVAAVVAYFATKAPKQKTISQYFAAPGSNKGGDYSSMSPLLAEKLTELDTTVIGLSPLPSIMPEPTPGMNWDNKW